LFAAAAIATHAGQWTTSGKTRLIDSLLTYLCQQNRFMGVVCIREHNKTVFNKAYGMMGAEAGRPVAARADTKYRIGSISKTYTAVMIMQLLEEKKLSLDDTLAKYFKEIPNAGKITLKQLLLHQSGLYNFTDDPQWKETYTYVSQKEMLDRFAKQQPVFAPGTQTAYSNTNYMLLGYIIEQITEKSLAENLQRRICKKIGLQHTLLPGGKTAIGRNEAISFSLNKGRWEPVAEMHVSVAEGAGGIIATAEEVGKFYEALLQRRLLQGATLEQMLPVEGENNITGINSFGYGIHSVPFGKEHSGYGHSGHIDAFSTMACYFPGDKISISLFDNGEVMGINQVAIYILSILFDKPYTFPDFTTTALTAQDIAGLAGIYATQELPLEITVKAHGNELWAQASGQDSFPLVALTRDKFEFKEADITMSFTRDEKGVGQKLAMVQDGEKLVLARKDPAASSRPSAEVAEAILSSYEGIYSAPSFPLKITIRKNGKRLSGQATGQSSFPLEAVSDTEFEFTQADLKIIFKKDHEGKTIGMTLVQGTRIELLKE